jgi:predicted HicB family RNase H-like nuclease
LRRKAGWLSFVDRILKKKPSGIRSEICSGTCWSWKLNHERHGYEGYSARIEFDAEDKIIFGRLAGISNVIGFQADDVSDLKQAFHNAVDGYVETCRKLGKAPQKPYSGKMMFRVDPEIHARAAKAAGLAGRSLNQ